MIRRMTPAFTAGHPSFFWKGANIHGQNTDLPQGAGQRLRAHPSGDAADGGVHELLLRAGQDGARRIYRTCDHPPGRGHKSASPFAAAGHMERPAERADDPPVDPRARLAFHARFECSKARGNPTYVFDRRTFRLV